MTIELGRALKAFNLVNMFEKKEFTFVAVISRKQQQMTFFTTYHNSTENSPPKVTIKLGRALKAFNIVAKFEKK